MGLYSVLHCSSFSMYSLLRIHFDFVDDRKKFFINLPILTILALKIIENFRETVYCIKAFLTTCVSMVVFINFSKIHTKDPCLKIPMRDPFFVLTISFMYFLTWSTHYRRFPPRFSAKILKASKINKFVTHLSHLVINVIFAVIFTKKSHIICDITYHGFRYICYN